MKRVILESPYRAETPWGKLFNRWYARRCLRHSIMQGEAPFASHLLYTQVLHDSDPEERQIGIGLGRVWAAQAEATVVYYDRGISEGMKHGIDDALNSGREVISRSLYPGNPLPVGVGQYLVGLAKRMSAKISVPHDRGVEK